MAKPIRKTNKKLEAALDRIFSIGAFVKVGIIGKPDNVGGVKADAGKEVLKPWQGDFFLFTSTSVTLVDVAVIHEFGTSTIPQRSFLRSTYAENKKKIPRAFEAEARRALKKKEWDPEEIMERIGIWFQGLVVKKFTNNDWPALKDPTRGGKNKKGNATPLVDTGQLRQAISYQVIKTKSGGAR